MPDVASLTELEGRQVLVTGGGVSGRAVIEPLRELGAKPTVTDGNPDTLAKVAELGAATATIDELLIPDSLDRFALVITSPGWRPDAPVLAAAAARGIPIWGDVEFSWRVDQAELYGPKRQWLVVTGTNGKTTTTSMLAAILQAADVASLACGNIGLPVLDALRMRPYAVDVETEAADAPSEQIEDGATAAPRRADGRAEVLAVELSSFQLYWAPSVRPLAGVVLNVAEDHLDWHGGMNAYVAAKARALSGRIAVVGLDDPVAAALGRRPRSGRTVGFRLGVPADGELGVVDQKLLDRAFTQAAILAEVGDISPQGPAGVLDALAAAALARAYGVVPAFVRDGLRAHQVGPHRTSLVRCLAEVDFVNDSKATNPHAARSSVLGHERVVWVAGGLLKGAAVDTLVEDIADRIAGAVLIGVDAAQIADALARHAPDVPVVTVETRDDAGVLELTGTGDADLMRAATAADVMRRAVIAAAGLARPGDTVLLAPAAASLDMFRDYTHRGDSFAAAVDTLTEPDVGIRV